jgi:hypothetical protein
MAKSKKVKSTLQPAQLEMWNKWLAANPVGSVNNLKGVSEDEWLTKFAGGGNFGSKVGDAFKFAGDTLLSTVGATDVIGDDAYKNQGFADASRVGEKLGAGAGQMVGSFFGAGQAVKMGQQAIGAIDGTDEERARVEQLRANPEASGKYAQSIGQMNKAIMPIAGAVGAAGQIGAGAVSGGFSGSNLQENLQIGKLGDAAFRAYGGKLMPDGGSIPNVQMDEQVQVGSDRYKELQKQQAVYDTYSKKQQDLSPYYDAYGSPKVTENKDNPGQSNYTFTQKNGVSPTFSSKREESMQGTINPIFESKGTGAVRGGDGSEEVITNTYMGPSNPGAPPAYDTYDNNSNLSIEEEKTFRPLQVGVYDHSSGNPTHRTAGFQYGYESEGTPEKITTVDPYTGEQLLSETDSFTSGMLNQNFPEMENVPIQNPSVQNTLTRDEQRAKAFADYSGDPIEFAQGGVMNKAQGDGKFVEYEGPTHAGGGIKVDAGGMPTNGQPIAEVEGGETMHDDGIESYIFSDRLVLNPGEKKKKTFADESKKINNKYKNVENDKIGEDSRNLELEELKIQQEELKEMMNPKQAQSQPQDMGLAAYGGNLQQYHNGGTFGHTHDGIDPASEKYNKAVNNALAGLEPQVNNSPQNISFDEPLDAMYGNIDLKLMEENYVKGTTPQEMESANRSQSLSQGQLPQDKINPAGYFASNIGNMNDLIQSSQPTKDNDFGRMNPNLVNYDAQRKELENQAGVSRAISRENARNSGGAGSAMTNQVISNALVNSNLGSGLSQSYMGEANANAQIRNQAEQVNTNIGMQEEIANQQDQAMGDSVKSKALHSMGQNTQGYVRDIKAAEVGNMNNKMWFDLVKEGKYVDYDYKDGRLVMTTKDGRKIEMKQKENGSFEEAK